MNCTFCHRKIDGQTYGCSCDDFTIACTGCRKYGCQLCKDDFSRTQLQFCVGCKQHKQVSKMFGERFHAFCFTCCLKSYKNAQGKRVILCKQINEPEKFQLYTFLKKFCYRCSKNISKQRPQGLDTGLRQIYPLDNNICRKCIQNETQKQNTPKFSSHNQYKKEFNFNEQYQKLRQSRNLRQSGMSKSSSQSKFSTNVSQNREKTSGLKQTPMQKWTRIQGTTFLNCMVCGYLALDDGVIDDDIVICRYCINKSKTSEGQLNGSRINQKQQYNSNGYTNNYYQGKKQYQTSYQPKVSASQKDNQFDFYDPYKQKRQIRKNLQTKIQNSVLLRKQQQRAKTPPKTPPKPSKISAPVTKSTITAVPNMKKHDSEQFQQNIPVQIRYVNDSDLIACQNCRIQIEPQSAIWDQNAGKPLCRCCYEDLKDQIRRQAQRSAYLNQKNNQENKNKFYNVRQQIRNQNKINQKTVDNSKSYLSPNYGQKQTISKKQDLQVQPIIQEQQRKTTLNRVKKSASWDEQIIMQPVQDHERRKREKQRSQKNKIIQEPQPEQDQIRFSYSVNSEDDQTNKKTIIRQEQKRPIEPEIIDDDQYTRRQKVKRMKSWDDTIVLQPINKSPSGEKVEKKTTLTQQYRKQEISAKQTFVTPKKNYSEQQSQPTIIQQTKDSKARVKKMQSWDEAILLEPQADYLQRKKQRLLQQNQPNQPNSTAKVQTTSSVKQQTGGYKKQYKFQERVSSREKTTKEASKQKQSRSQNINTNQPQYRASTTSYINNPAYYSSNNPSTYTNMRQNAQKTTSPYRNSSSSSNLDPNYQNFNKYQKPASTTPTSRGFASQNQRIAHEQYRSFDRKFQQMKKQLDQNMNQSFSKLLGTSTAQVRSPIRQSQNLGRRDYYATNQPLPRSTVNSRSPYMSYTPVDSQYYYAPYQKNDDRSTQYSQSSFSQSRAREPDYSLGSSRTNDPYLHSYSPYQSMQSSNVRPQSAYGAYTQLTRHDGLTGFTRLTKKQNRVCGHCKNRFTAVNNDYFVMGDNVCVDCYNKYQRRY